MVDTQEQVISNSLNNLRKKPFNLNDEDIQWVEKSIADMSFEEKVGQLFCLVAFTDDTNILKGMVATKPGGVMLRPMSTKSAVETVRLFQENSKIPMLISANLEAGGNGFVKEGTKIGSPMQIAATNDEKMAYKLGVVCGREGSSVGANWAFAPIIDIDYNFRNPITNTRTFGSEPERVRQMGINYVKGVQEHGVAASIKHFPGDGVDELDQHLVTSINDLSCEEWDATFGSVYKACIDEGAMTVMVGHIMQPAYSRKLAPELSDKDLLPASLSYELTTKLLKEELGFNGLVVTDASTMAGLTIPMPREQAVPQAIAAGCDMFLFTKNLQEDYNFMREGIEKGIITEGRLYEALSKILGLKAALGLHKKKENGSLLPTFEKALETIGVEEHKAWSIECADNSVTLVKEEENVLPLSSIKHKRVLLYSIETGEGFFHSSFDAVGTFKAMLEKEGFEVNQFDPKTGFEGMMAPNSVILDNYDLIIYLANMATKSNQTTVRIEWAQPLGINVPIYITSIPTIFISVENPYHLLDVPRVKTFINAYASSEVVLELIVEKLLGRSEFKGINPIDPFCGRWDTKL
ncbi:glycoside hydrolase family 3 N-terminal domain-containing protein [Peribacillus sp. NPDC096379]|uniref:glycoside hydrolase family 3 N-terminal domain-containing protein n=1 Tax=Peribacillus sp. NPDC096379 TaxID=3364393 RepID=UPI003808E924